MIPDLKILAASGFALALAACGSPAREADDPVAINDVPAADVTTAAPGDAIVREGASEATDTAGEATESEEEVAAPAPSPSSSASASASAAPTVAAVTEPPAGFAICSACHSVERGEHGIGPSLAGVFGSHSASKPGYDYSEAMESSDLTWNQATLDRFLTNPMGVVPGTTMVYPGLKDAAQRQAVIAYLKSL